MLIVTDQSDRNHRFDLRDSPPNPLIKVNDGNANADGTYRGALRYESGVKNECHAKESIDTANNTSHDSTKLGQ